MNCRRGSTPICKGCYDSIKGVEPSMNDCKVSTAIYKSFDD